MGWGGISQILMVFTKKCNNYKELKGLGLFYVSGNISVILSEDLGCYIGDIHKTGHVIDLGKTLKSLPWWNFITTLTCLINLDFGAIRDFI